MKIGVLALQGAFREHREVLDALGVESVEVRVPEALGALDGLIIPGGESTTMSQLLDSSGLRDPVGACLRDGLPVFGTCAGMILLARDVLDGRADQQSFASVDIAVRRNAYGRQRDSFEADLDIPGVAARPGDAFRGVFIRAPRIEHAGPAVTVLARHDEHPVLARQGSAWVSSFHPELAGDLRVHEAFLREVSA
jgi:pyridoxal 5'-phosphate synthase pdxT subunit